MGSSFSFDPAAPAPEALEAPGGGPLGSMSRTDASSPSAAIFCATAPFGKCIDSILKYLVYFGSFFRTGPVAPAASAAGVGSEEPPPAVEGGGPSRIDGSNPSAFIFCSTAPRGRCMASILKNLAYFGSVPGPSPVTLVADDEATVAQALASAIRW